MTEINKEEASKLIKESQGSTCSSDIDFESEEKYDALQRVRNETKLILKERDGIIKMRESWSRWLLRAIIAIIIFDFFVVLAVGFQWMKFDKAYMVPFFIVESFAKTIGLALIVVNFLFDIKLVQRDK